jgi:hypothetical protein
VGKFLADFIKWVLDLNIFSINLASLTEAVSKAAAEEIFGALEVQVGHGRG